RGRAGRGRAGNRAARWPADPGRHRVRGVRRPPQHRGAQSSDAARGFAPFRRGSRGRPVRLERGVPQLPDRDGDCYTHPRRVVALRDAARKENHLYGSLSIRSSTSGATARVTPLETWQWPELARQASVPMTFVGPTGRYRVELLVGGQVRQQATGTIAAGT